MSHKSVLKALVTAGAVTAGLGVPALVMPTAASAATTPVVFARVSGWSPASIRPAWILIGEGGSPTAHIPHWSTWDKGEPNPHATANGTLWTDNCLPNCAQGKESVHRLVVTLSVVKTHRGVRYYSRMTWSTPGYRLPGSRSSTVVLHYSASGGNPAFWH